MDITIDYKAFDCDDPFADGVSKTKIKTISQQIKTQLTSYIEHTVKPYYEKIISEQFKKNAPTVELGEEGETLHLHYPSVLQQKRDYIKDSIRLEFGGRNLITPGDTHMITALRPNFV